MLERAVEALVSSTADAIATLAGEVLEKKRAPAVLARDVVERWPWPRSSPAGIALNLLLAWSPPPPTMKEPEPGGWPTKVGPAHVVQWARKTIDRLAPTIGEALTHATVTPEKLLGFNESAEWPTVVGLALLYLADQDVQEQLRLPAIAIDAGKSHHALLSRWRDIPKDTRVPVHFNGDEIRVELLTPQKPGIQLTLFPGQNFGEAMVNALREWRGWFGLRNWAGLLKLLSVEGGRRGWVRWTLDDHMATLGYRERRRQDPAFRELLADEIELFTKMQIAVYKKDGTILWERRPILQVGSRFGHLEGSKHALDGMELQINPLLYHGVRNTKTGELGSKWWWAPAKLAQVDHVKHPHALALGFILPIRWRWALPEGKDHVTLSGESLLDAANIQVHKYDPSRAWTALERDLEELRRIDGIDRWEWSGEPRTTKAMVHLYPAKWMLDRMALGLTPIEKPPGPSATIKTGSDFVEWRKGLGLTQAAAAERLKVSVDTIGRAEAKPEKALGPALRKAFAKALAETTTETASPDNGLRKSPHTSSGNSANSRTPSQETPQIPAHVDDAVFPSSKPEGLYEAMMALDEDSDEDS